MFSDKRILPDFELLTLKLKAVQSGTITKTEYNSWFDALEYMKDKTRMETEESFVSLRSSLQFNKLLDSLYK